MTPHLTLGDRLREVADRLQTEREVQIKATARILGAAAQMAQNHDRLIAEVSEMVQEDLEVSGWSVPRLKREFGTLKVANAHFGKQARRWQDLVAQLSLPSLPPAIAPSEPDWEQRITQLQAQVQQLQTQVRNLQRAIEHLQAKDADANPSPKPRTGRPKRT